MQNELNKSIIRLKNQLSLELSDLEVRKIRLELSGKDTSNINKIIEEKKDFLLKLTSQIKDSFGEQTMLEAIRNYSTENQNLENSGAFVYDTGNGKIILRKGYLVTIGGYTSVGKSWFVLRMIKQFCSQLKDDKKILLWSMEMGGMDYAERADLIGLTPEDMNKIIVLGNTRNTIEDLKIYLQHTKHEFDVIFVDHINQFLIPKGETEYSNLCNITGILNNISKNQNILVIQVAQLNRNNMNKGNVVGLQNLRGSGSIEQDSNIVILLKKEEDENSIAIDDNCITGINDTLTENRYYKIAKNRHGPITGWIKHNFVPNIEEFKKTGKDKNVFETANQNFENGELPSVFLSDEDGEFNFFDPDEELKNNGETKKLNGEFTNFNYKANKIKEDNNNLTIKDKSYYSKL